jgi:hypothetical protein
MSRVARSAALVALTLALGACSWGGGGSGPAATARPTGPAAERPASTAALTIESPANGEVVRAPVELVVGLRGAELVDRTSTDLRPDQGHLHVNVDGQLISMTSGLTQRLPDLEAGSHVVTVEFVANDHAPFEPRVLAATTFEVRG